MTYFPPGSTDSAASIANSYTNNSSISYAKGVPISIGTDGVLGTTDIRSRTSVYALVGITTETLGIGKTKSIASYGQIQNVTISGATIGCSIFIAPPGSGNILTINEPNIGTYGYLAGDYVVYVGTVEPGDTVGSFDLQVNIDLRGQL